MIKLVAFDLGDVLLKYNPIVLAKEFIKDPDEAVWFIKEIFGPIEKVNDIGVPIEQASADAVLKYPKYKPFFEAFKTRSDENTAERIAPNVQVFQAVKKAGYPITIWSNFQDEGWADTLKRHPFIGTADYFVVSAHIGILKPEPGFFDAAFAKHPDIAPENIVFIDDRDDITKAARARGVKTVTYNPSIDLEAELKKIGLVF